MNNLKIVFQVLILVEILAIGVALVRKYDARSRHVPDVSMCQCHGGK